MIYRLVLYLGLGLFLAACSPKGSDKVAAPETEAEAEMAAAEANAEAAEGQGGEAALDIDQMAKEMCGCAAKVTELTGELNKLVENDAAAHQEEIKKLSETLSVEVGKMQDCAAEMDKRYPRAKMDEETQAEFVSSMRKQCPKVVELMEGQ